jgi:hypothetical protein
MLIGVSFLSDAVARGVAEAGGVGLPRPCGLTRLTRARRGM